MKILDLFNSTKPRKQLLFTAEIELDPYDENGLQERCAIVRVRPNGSVFALNKYAGQIPCWDYIEQFDTPDTMKRTAFNRFEVEVCGTADDRLLAEPVVKRPYMYDGIVTSTPAMLPNREYLCSLILRDDHFDVIFDSGKIGEIRDRKNRGTIEKINKMLGYGWRTTAVVNISNGKLALRVDIVKV